MSRSSYYLLIAHNLVCKPNAKKTDDNLDCLCKEGYFFWTVAFTILILIESIAGVLTMGLSTAMMRWTLSYLIYTPVELAISELILASVVYFSEAN